MRTFKENLQKFFIYFFTGTSVLIVVLGIIRVKKGETGVSGTNNPLQSGSMDASGVTITDPSRKIGATVRGTTQTAFTGKAVQTPWGALATAIRVKDGKIVTVTIPTLPDSPPSINAESYLVAQALRAGNANIQGVSGATYTSNAFRASLESALAQAATVETFAARLSSLSTTQAQVSPSQVSYTAHKQTTAPTFSSPTQNTTTTKTATGVSGTFTGSNYSTPFGNVVASITVANGKITGVSMPQVPNSPPSIQAEPYLVQQALAAGSANIQGVSGATYTSLAFKSSLESAIAQANSTASSQGQTAVTVAPNTAVATPSNTPSIKRTYGRHDDEENEEWDD